jgi:hypothetical protein
MHRQCRVSQNSWVTNSLGSTTFYSDGIAIHANMAYANMAWILIAFRRVFFRFQFFREMEEWNLKI